MSQRIFGFGMSGTGIVSFLVLAGLFLNVTQINAAAGQVAIWGGVGIGILFGLLGTVGIFRKYV